MAIFTHSIKNSFLEDKERWILWAPVLFGLGVVFYFFFPRDSSLFIPVFLFLAAASLSYFLREELNFLFALIIAIFLAGYLWSKFCTEKLYYTPTVKHKLYALAIGRVDDVAYFYNPILKRTVPRITIKNLDLYKVDRLDKDLFADKKIKKKSNKKKKKIKKIKSEKNLEEAKKLNQDEKIIDEEITKKPKRKRRKKQEAENEMAQENSGLEVSEISQPQKENVKKNSKKKKSFSKKPPKSKKENKTIIRNYLNLDGYQEVERSFGNFYFDENAWEGSKYKKPPRKIIINVNTKHGDFKIGDLIKTAVALEPLRKVNMIGGYDSAFDYYFQGIGALGYAASQIKVVKPARHFEFDEDIKFLRQKIAQKIFDAIEYNQASIAVALLVGLQNYIPKEIITDIRNSGLAHLLSISGLHLTLACGIFFFLIRFLLSLNSYLVLNYNIKKIAAFVSIFTGLIYLLLAGMPVPAVRSFIMVSLIFLAVIFDRSPNPHRGIALAALIILIISPNVIFSVSFQFSFAAILALLTVYDFSKKNNLSPGNKPLHLKLFFYLLGIIISSIAVELVIAPLSIYHFNNFIAYSVLANLLAIPLTSFITMPLGFLSLFLMPFGLEKLALIPMSYSIDWVMNIADFVSSLPHAVNKISMISPASFAFVVIGGLWFCLWYQRWRFLAILPIGIGIYLAMNTVFPNLLIDGERKYFAVLDENKKIVFSKKSKQLSVRQKEWLQKAGEVEANYNLDWCDDLSCLVVLDQQKILFLTARNKIDFICRSDADIIVNLTKKYQLPNCVINKFLINNSDLEERGNHFLYLQNNRIIKIVNASSLSLLPESY
jgi:competence protein ComEC